MSRSSWSRGVSASIRTAARLVRAAVRSSTASGAKALKVRASEDQRRGIPDFRIDPRRGGGVDRGVITPGLYSARARASAAGCAATDAAEGPPAPALSRGVSWSNRRSRRRFTARLTPEMPLVLCADARTGDRAAEQHTISRKQIDPDALKVLLACTERIRRLSRRWQRARSAARAPAERFRHRHLRHP